MSQMSQVSKMIKNVNVLDLTTAEEPSLAGITAMENINLLLCSRKSAKLLSGIAMKNINVIVEIPEIPENCRLTHVNGQLEIDESFAANTDQPLYIVVNGELIFKPNVSLETIEQTIAGIVVNGKIYCKEQLNGMIRQKLDQHNGDIQTYMDDADSLYFNVRVDNTWLQSQPSGANLSFIGKTILLDPLETSLLKEKLNKVEFIGQLIIREEILKDLQHTAVNLHKCKIVTIPKGAVYVAEDLTLDCATMGRFEQSKLYITGTLRLESDVTLEALKSSFESIHTDEMIICRKELKAEVLKRSDVSSAKVLDYSGKLRKIDGEYKLTESELKYTEEPLTLIVNGILDIAPNIDPQMLFDKIERIDNYGVINGSSEQCGVVQTKLHANKGVISERDESDSEGDSHDSHGGHSANEDSEVTFIKNMNYLKL